MKKTAKILSIIALVIGIIWAIVGFFGSWVGGAVISAGQEVIAEDSQGAHSTLDSTVNVMLNLIGSLLIVVIGGVLGIIGSDKKPSKIKPLIFGILTLICGILLFPLYSYLAAFLYLVVGFLLIISALKTNIDIKNEAKENKGILVSGIILGVIILVIGMFFLSQKKGVNETSIIESETLNTEFAQDSIAEAQIIEYKVTRISGSNKNGETTKVVYKSCTQLIAETNEKSQREMWTQEKLQDRINYIKSSSIGGRIILSIERLSLESANTKWFTIIVKNHDEEELFRQTLDSYVPDLEDKIDDYWWNMGTASINKKLKTPFYVYVVESGAKAPFKFEITAITDADNSKNKDETKITDIKSLVKETNSIKNWTNQIQKEVFDGEGEATYFLKDGQLRKIVAKFYGEESWIIEEYYLDNGSLSFVSCIVDNINHEFYGDKEENEYYFNDAKLFHIKSSEKNSFTTTEIQTKEKEILDMFKELNKY